MDRMLKVLDVGCGTFPYNAKENEEVISVDFRTEVGPTGVHNLCNFAYPFQDNYFDMIYASHILGHLPDQLTFMSEMYCILKPGGTAIVRVPDGERVSLPTKKVEKSM